MLNMLLRRGRRFKVQGTGNMVFDGRCSEGWIKQHFLVEEQEQDFDVINSESVMLGVLR
jgi:hypothetical protein